jgi:hypothetical protein
MPSVDVQAGAGNVVHLSRGTASAADAKRQAVERLRALLPGGGILYAVRRAHDPGFGWIVCDFYRIDGSDVLRVTEDVARALDCFDPAREIGVKLRSAAAGDPLAAATDRLSTLLFGAPGRLDRRLFA